MDSKTAPREAFSTLAAWAIHAFTASGAVLAFLAYRAVQAEQFRLALLYLGIALVVDGVDGTLARLAGVKQRAPGIDGTILDLVVDYLTYVFVPAILIHRAGLIAPPYDSVAVAAILLSSLYTFARVDMKTDDNYFRGFPALWNIVVFYLVMLQPGQTVAAILVALFVVLTFAPVDVVHPVRVRGHRLWLAGLTIVWGVASFALLWRDWPAPWMQAWLALSLASAAGLLLIGLLRTWRGPGRGV
jgi:phosphatidylcholine synthase